MGWFSDNILKRLRSGNRSKDLVRVEPKISSDKPRRVLNSNTIGFGSDRGVSHIKDILKPYIPPPGVLPKNVDSGVFAKDSSSMPGDGQLGLSSLPLFGSYLNNQIFADGVTFMGYPLLSEMAQRSEYRHMVEIRAKESTREWIKFTVSGDDDKADKIKEIEDEFDRLRVRDHFMRMAEYDGFFGLGHLYIQMDGVDFNDGNNAKLMAPLITDDPKLFKKGSLKGFKTIDPIWTTPSNYNSNNPLLDDFYEPTSWFIQGREVSATRLLTFVSRPVPDILKPTYNFGGLSLTQMAKPYVDNWLRTRQSVSDLVNAFSIVVFSTNLTSLMETPLPGMDSPPGEMGIMNRMSAFNQMRSNQGTFVMDKESENMEILNVSLNGLSALQAQAQEQMASVSSTPLVKLLGITPSGLNASSDGEIRVFYDFISSFQENLFRRNLQRVLHLVMLNLWGEIDESIDFEFNPLWQLDQVGLSAVQKTQADIDIQNIEAGVVSAEEVRKRLSRDDESQYTGIDLSKPPPPPLYTSQTQEEMEDDLHEGKVPPGVDPGERQQKEPGSPPGGYRNSVRVQHLPNPAGAIHGSKSGV